MSLVGIHVERRRDALVLHVVAAADLDAVQVGDVAVVVGHLEEQVVEVLPGVVHGELAPQVDGHVVAAHVAQDRGVVAVAVADARRAVQPARVVEVRLGPVIRGHATRPRGRLPGALEVLPSGAEVENDAVRELHAANVRRIEGRLREAG